MAKLANRHQCGGNRGENGMAASASSVMKAYGGKQA
jgi:hypothetical protein